MNIKRNISKLVSGLLCFSMIFSNVLPVYAADAVITENTLDGEDLSVNERNLEDITVTYKQASSFFVTIPKTIVLDGWKQSTYAVKVSGDIGAEQCVYVAPVDMIDETENIDFYMKDQASENAKDDVVASVTHNKFHWNAAEVAEGYRQDDNLVSAPDLTAGAWRGIFQMEIKLETHVTHTHNYVETITKEPTCTETGEKTYTCDCGDSYTEEIPAKGHHFEDGECTDCGEKEPDYHKHSYTETITKEPTCTEAGEKTYTCDCGDSYTEEIPAKGHHYGDDDKCTECGELKPGHKHNYTETITKEPTCTEKGEKTFTCVCGDSYTEEIPAKGHHYENGVCTDCGEKDPDYHEHSYDDGAVTKEPTCTEVGEKTFTCSECGHTYTEEIPATGHIYGDDDICIGCGEIDPNHVHNYIPYEFTVEPKLVNNTISYTSNSTKQWALTSATSESNSYSTTVIHRKNGYYCTSSATFEINVPNDYEGDFDYKYSYSCSPNSTDKMGYSLSMNINGTNNTAYSKVYMTRTNGQIDKYESGSKSGTKTVTLKPGKNTFIVNCQGTSKYTTDSTSSTSNGYITLFKYPLYNGAEYHICNVCGKKEPHHFVNGICIECGWNEKNDGTKYNLIIDDARFLNNVSVTSSTQNISNGDVIELSEKSDDTYNFEGYSIVRAVKNIQLCAPNVGGGHYTICTRTGGPGRFALFRSPTYEYEFGIKTQWVDTQNGPYYNSELSDYFWKQTAESDIITIEKPMIYAFTANEDITCSNIYSADCCSSGSIQIEDITRNKIYNLKYGSVSDPDGNVRILSTSSHTDSSTSSATRADKYSRKYMIYLQPGQYRFVASGQSGDGSSFGANSHYWLTMGSPLSASETLAAPVINGVHHTASGGTLYELIPIENGQEFDINTMYSIEGSKNVYLISNWTAKTTE